MNKTRYSATEFGRNKPMTFRPSGTLSNGFEQFGPLNGYVLLQV